MHRTEAKLQRLGRLLAASTHVPLRALVHSALLPAAGAALRLAALVHHPEDGPAAATPAPSPGQDLGLGLGLEAMRLRGRAWALLGLARLHLAAPPAGADPAAKRALKAAHLDARAAEELLPEIQARKAPLMPAAGAWHVPGLHVPGLHPAAKRALRGLCTIRVALLAALCSKVIWT